MNVRVEFIQVPLLLFISLNMITLIVDDGSSGFTPAATIRSVSKIALRQTRWLL